MGLVEAEQYFYLNTTGCTSIEGVSDADSFSATRMALRHLGFSEAEEKGMFRLLAGLLHLGNLKFESNEEGKAKLATTSDIALQQTASLLQIDVNMLRQSVLCRSITVR